MDEWMDGIRVYSKYGPHEVRICSSLPMVVSIPCWILEQKHRSSRRSLKPQWCIYVSEIITGGGGFLMCWQGEDWQWLLSTGVEKGPTSHVISSIFFFFFLWTIYFSSESVFIFLTRNTDGIVKLDHFHFLRAVENVLPLILQDNESLFMEKSFVGLLVKARIFKAAFFFSPRLFIPWLSFPSHNWQS